MKKQLKDNSKVEAGFTRRDILRTGSAALGFGLFAGLGNSVFSKGVAGKVLTPFPVPRFVQDLPMPVVKKPLAVGPAPFTPGDVYHGIAPEFYNRTLAEDPKTKYYETPAAVAPPLWYETSMQHGVAEIVPGVKTPILGYDGLYPGPTYKTRVGQPVVIRYQNQMEEETSIHLHGGHNPAHSDGFPSFFVLPNQARDYYYANTVPMEKGQPDFNESPSTMWYHSHVLDITDHQVVMGLAGFFLTYDDLELGLINNRVLPNDPYDVPIAIQDRRFNADGSIWFDPLDHDGYMGDVYVLNGKAFPKMNVERKKYRFRFLDGCAARFLELRLSTGEPFLQIGNDTWLLPQAISSKTLLMSPAKRADVIIDFTNAPNEVFLENILVQDSGRGPAGKYADRVTQVPGLPMMKFVVQGPKQPSNASVTVGTPLRPHTPIQPSEVVGTRKFTFHRGQGAWQVNKVFYDPDRADATPTLGTAEKWILENPGGGWWHPIHIHLESHTVIRVDGAKPRPEQQFKSDTTILGAGSTVEILMKFRTFKGPFSFHCHNNAHEDMRMMMNLDPRVTPTKAGGEVQQVFP